MLTAIYKDGDAKEHCVLVAQGSKADKHWRGLGYSEPVAKASKPTKPTDTKADDTKATDTKADDTKATDGNDSDASKADDTKTVDPESKPQAPAKAPAARKK